MIRILDHFPGTPNMTGADIWVGKRCLRVFLRGFRNPRPYAWHKYGFYAFGAGPIGFMYWPPNRAGSQQ